MSNVFRPIREHLDLRFVPEYEPDPRRHLSWLATAFDELFARRASGVWMCPALRAARDADDFPSPEQKPHIFFKWRGPSPNSPNAHLIRETLDRHNALPLVLVRRSVGAHAIKMLLAQKVYNNRYPQFGTLKMGSEEYQRYLAKQDSLRITFTAEDLADVKREASDVLLRTKHLLNRVRYFFPAHQNPLLLIAEDVFTPLVDRRRHHLAMQRLLGDVAPLAPDVEIEYRKSGLELEHCANAQDLLDEEEMKAIERDYNKILAGCDIIQFPSEDAP